MFCHRVRSEGLAAHSYLIGSDAVAAVIDPRRDAEVYVQIAARQGAHIECIFETHRNEDFIVGSTELAALAGAEVFHGGQIDFAYGSPLRDGKIFRLGRGAQLATLHTPGHTEESFSYALTDLSTGSSPVMVFTGDALFVGSVGRLDLYGGGGREREAAGLLFDSLFERLLALGGEVILCPAHVGGSVCGSGLAERELSSLGLERRHNPALKEAGREAFIRRQTAQRFFKPAYFSRMEVLNLEGPRVKGGPPRPRPMRPKEFARAVELGGVMLDTREPHSWAAAHLKGSYNVWLEGVAPYAGFVVPYGRPLLLVAEGERQLEQALISLFRLGYDEVAGYLTPSQVLEGMLSTGLTEWYHRALPLGRSGVLSVQELHSAVEAGRCHVLDVREDSEWTEGHIKGAQHIFFGKLEARLAEVPRDAEIAVHCSIGHRSGIAASLLARSGFPRVSNVLGGFGTWQAAGYPVARNEHG